MNSFSPVWRVDLRLQPSRLFLALTLALHLAALLAVLANALPWSGRLVLAGLLGLSLWGSWRRETAQAGVIVREQEGGWWLEVGRRRGQAQLHRRQLWRYLVVMEFRGQGEQGSWRERVVVLPDAVPPEVFRRLQVRLRYSIASSVRTPGAVEG